MNKKQKRNLSIILGIFAVLILAFIAMNPLTVFSDVSKNLDCTNIGNGVINCVGQSRGTTTGTYNILARNTFYANGVLTGVQDPQLIVITGEAYEYSNGVRTPYTAYGFCNLISNTANGNDACTLVSTPSQFYATIDTINIYLSPQGFNQDNTCVTSTQEKCNGENYLLCSVNTHQFLDLGKIEGKCGYSVTGNQNNQSNNQTNTNPPSNTNPSYNYEVFFAVIGLIIFSLILIKLLYKRFK